MTAQQELEEVTRNSLLKATGPDGDLIRDFAAQMRHDRAAIDSMMGAVVEEVEAWETDIAELQADADQVAAAFNARHAVDGMQDILDRELAAGNRDAALKKEFDPGFYYG